MLVLSCKGDIFPLGFEHEVTFVVGVVAVSFALVYLNYPVAYLVQKISVVSDHHKRTFVVVQVFLQILCHVVVQVVCRLVKYQYVTA